MNTQELIATAQALVAGDKGLLAMDESNPTCNKHMSMTTTILQHAKLAA
jgi:fructose-bisphosphate aldolase class I